MGRAGNGYKLQEGTTAVINVAGRNILGMPFEHVNNIKFFKQVEDSRINTTELLRNAIMRMESPPRVCHHLWCRLLPILGQGSL